MFTGGPETRISGNGPKTGAERGILPVKSTFQKTPTIYTFNIFLDYGIFFFYTIGTKNRKGERSMKKQLSILLVVVFMLGASNCFAGDFNYSWVSVGYGQGFYWESERPIDIDADGLGLSFSLAMNEEMFVTASYFSTDFKTDLSLSPFNNDLVGDIDLEDIYFAFGYHHPISDNTDLVLTFGRESTNISATQGEDDFTYTDFTIGFRSKTSDKCEVSGGIIHITGDESYADTGTLIGTRFHLKEKVALDLTMKFIESQEIFTFGIVYDINR